jgi:hypothetical protein
MRDNKYERLPEPGRRELVDLTAVASNSAGLAVRRSAAGFSLPRTAAQGT